MHDVCWFGCCRSKNMQEISDLRRKLSDREKYIADLESACNNLSAECDQEAADAVAAENALEATKGINAMRHELTDPGAKERRLERMADKMRNEKHRETLGVQLSEALDLAGKLEAAKARIVELEDTTWPSETVANILARAERAEARVAELDKLDRVVLFDASIAQMDARIAELERHLENVGVYGNAGRYWEGRWRDDNARAERAEAECKALRQNFATYLVPAYKADPLKVARTCDEQLDQSGALLGYVRDIARAALNPSPAEKSPT